jgi:PKD repeat protein
VYAQNTFVVMSPEYSSCGNVSINGVVITTPPTMGLVWDWGDGSKTTSMFPATHRYATNDDFTVTVTAVGCNSLIETQYVSVINAGASGCPPPASATFYHLVPYNMHLTAGATGAVPLHVVDQDGNPVSGTLTFSTSDPQDLVSISPSGYVTALRAENTSTEIGVWVDANLNGQPILSNTCVVRVLPENYGVPFAEVSGQRTTLYYPTSVNSVNIAALVSQFQVPAVNEYSYQIEFRLMATSPFNGGRQIFEVDFGVTGPNSPCGISGNPLRLGWNIEDSSEWANCFMVPFDPFSVPNPQWFVLYHELGHNMTWASFIFGTAMNHFLYSEGLASAIALTAMEEIVADPVKYPLGDDAAVSLQYRHDDHVKLYLADRLTWVSDPNGANFASLNPNIVDGIWLHHKTGVPHFADRFFLPLQPLMIEHLGEVLCSVQTEGDVGKHTFFAALMSAAAGTDLYDTFLNDYNYPLDPSLYDTAYTAFTGIIAQRECPGDFDKDGSSDVEDLAVFAADFGKTSCSGGPCNGDFNTDGDVDGSELSAFILKFGRTDCL